MSLAIAQARMAADAGEVPVGAVIVRNGQVLASGHNNPIANHDPTAHAEIVALRAAANVLGNYRLEDCTLYVTLEPCAMCTGAILQARLPRVVFGASDPKTGAAGSVMDLFREPKLNHQTRAEGGILATECSNLLTDFFQKKRGVDKAHAQPLREDALRTPEYRFLDLKLSNWPSHYVHTLPSLRGLRMHYVDVGPRNAEQVLLCLHSATSWGYVFYEKALEWVASGQRVIIPDLIGFGKSDKPKRAHHHSQALHQQSLIDLLNHLQVDRFTLTLQGQLDEFATSTEADNAPFPDAGYRVALKAFACGPYRVSAIADALLVAPPD